MAWDNSPKTCYVSLWRFAGIFQISLVLFYNGNRFFWSYKDIHVLLRIQKHLLFIWVHFLCRKELFLKESMMCQKY